MHEFDVSMRNLPCIIICYTQVALNRAHCRIYFCFLIDVHILDITTWQIMGFSLNDFLWIQGIQWIIIKSKTGMVTRGITQLVVGVLPVIVIQSVFSLLSWDRYLLPLSTLNRYQPTDSSRKSFFTTISRNVSIARYRMSQVIILPLDLVMIHWIRWIQRKSFRENWIIYLA